MIPPAVESMWAVFGGLIPIVGAVAVGLILWHAVRDNPSDEDRGDEDRGDEDDSADDP